MIIKTRSAILVATGFLCTCLAYSMLCTPCIAQASLWHDILVSVLTGCVFSAPGALISIVTESTYSKREQKVFLRTLEGLLDRFSSATATEKSLVLNSLNNFYFQAIFSLHDNLFLFGKISLSSGEKVTYRMQFNDLINSVFLLSQNSSEEPKNETIEKCLSTINLLLEK